MKLEPDAQVVRGISVNGKKVFEAQGAIHSWLDGLMSGWQAQNNLP